MYTVRQAVKIALLENTGLANEAINSVIAAVVELTGSRRVGYYNTSNSQLTTKLEATQGNNALLAAGVIVEVCIPAPPDDDIVTVSMEGEATCWIIERVGHPITITHYRTVADSQRSMGAVVTPHIARL